MTNKTSENDVQLGTEELTNAAEPAPCDSRRKFIARAGKAVYVAPALTVLPLVSVNVAAQSGPPPPPTAPGAEPTPEIPD